MIVAVDLDGTIDSDPAGFASLMAALKAAGHQVIVLTGASSKTPTQQDLQEKAEYLKSLGLGDDYDQLVCFGSPPHKAKAKWCAQNHVDMLIDNSTKTAKKASKVTTVLVPYNSASDKSAVKDLPDAACRVLKAVEEQRYTLGLAYPANRPDVGEAADGHRDFASAKVLEQAAWNYLRKSVSVGLRHADGTAGHGTVVESYIWRGPDWHQADTNGDGAVIKAGDWLMGVVWDEPTWPLIKARELNGFSPQGKARRRVPSSKALANLRSE